MYTVILIDDELWALDALSTCFENQTDFAVVGSYSSSRNAWELILKNPPDVVFTDIKMPVFSGLDLAKMAGEAGLKTQFVIVSGYDDFDYLRQAICAKVFDYCMKPIQPKDVQEILNRLKGSFDEAHKEDAANYDSVIIAPISRIFNPQFQKVISYINENYQHTLRLEDISEMFFISESSLAQLFIKHFNTTFSKYLVKLRMEHAALLLNNSVLNTAQIAAAVGYSDYYYFNKVFKKYFGQTPYRYARRYDDEAE